MKLIIFFLFTLVCYGQVMLDSNWVEFDTLSNSSYMTYDIDTKEIRIYYSEHRRSYEFDEFFEMVSGLESRIKELEGMITELQVSIIRLETENYILRNKKNSIPASRETQ